MIHGVNSALRGRRRLPAIWILVCALGLSPLETVGQDSNRWVTDRFEVTMRTGKSTQQAIVRMLPSGARVQLIEDDPESGYSLVRTSRGAEGWVLRRYLLDEPPARVTLPGVTDRLRQSDRRRQEAEQELRELREERAQLQRQIGQLEGSADDLQSELTEIRRLSANVVQIEEQNKRLREQLDEQGQLLTELEAENRRFASRANREWFVVGAGVVIVGMLMGLILPRIRWRRKSSWGEL